MPKPIICLSEQLNQYLESFRECFSKRQWKYFVTVLLGLIECEERKTLTGMLRVIGEKISISGLSRFLNKYPWSTDEVSETWMNRFRRRMRPLVKAEHKRLRAEQGKSRGRPKATVVIGYVIFDDSVHKKPKGRKMEGLSKHYSHSEGKVVTGHSMFAGLYVLLGCQCPLKPRIYRSKNDCELGGIPFLSKIDMAKKEIENFHPIEGTHTHILTDTWYLCKKLIKAAKKRGWDFSGGLKKNRTMRLIKADRSREWVTLSQYATRLAPEDWQVVNWPSRQGGHKCYAHIINTWIRKLGPTLLLVTCKDPYASQKSIRFWGSTVSDMDAQTFVDTLAIRWNIETLFEYDKDLLGSDHYQLMSAEAILRFWTLISCLLCFLDEQRSFMNSPNLTYGEIRRIIQMDHMERFIHWIIDQFNSGITAEQLFLRLAL